MADLRPGIPAVGTATTAGARDHARAQAGRRVQGMPTIPATTARFDDEAMRRIPAGDLLWDEALEGGEYAAHRLPRGTTLRLSDTEGDACAHVAVHHADLPSERLNLADTTKVQWQMYPTAGSVLLSGCGRVLMALVDDSSGRHDTICGPPTAPDHEAKYGNGRVDGPFPNARDRLMVALAKFGLDRRDVPPSISFFKGVRVDEDGALRLDPCPAQPGTHVDLLAELDVLVAVANVPHVLDDRPAYTCTPLRVTAWRGAPTTEGDARRNATPEVQRAYWNNDDWLLGR